MTHNTHYLSRLGRIFNVGQFNDGQLHSDLLRLIFNVFEVFMNDLKHKMGIFCLYASRANYNVPIIQEIL